MNKTLVIILGLSALVLTASAADEAKDKGKGKGKGGEAHAELVKKYDKNGDGTLDKAERAAMSDEDKAKLPGGKGKGGGKKKGSN